MKRLIPATAIFLGWATAVWAAQPVALTTLRAVHSLTNAEASQRLPVAFMATVTYYREDENSLFVQDGDAAIFVFDTQETNLVPGDRVLVQGRTDADFSPEVRSEKITLLRHGAVPRPVSASFEELIRGRHDCMLVTVRAVVHAADLEQRSNLRNSSLPMVTATRMKLFTAAGSIEASIDSDKDAGALANLLDAEVEITGVAGGAFDGKQQQRGALLHVSNADWLGAPPRTRRPRRLPSTSIRCANSLSPAPVPGRSRRT